MAGAGQRIDTATVLFTDLVGSTAQRSRLGEEAADELRLTHDALLRDAITGQRGVVVKHTGDGVMATFSAAVDAVAAAVAIQQGVYAHNRRSDQERFEVRVGISVGDVTFDGDDCFGLPVIEAQRLEAVAEGGQILCAEIVQHLARGRGGHEFTSVGDLELKGIPEAVPAVAVGWTPVVQVAMARETPLPPVLSAPVAFDLAGRADELAVLVDAWKESADGQSRCVLISGEPGIGKTRLSTEIALLARKNGALVLAGRCDEEVGLPYQPFVEAARFQLSLADEIPNVWFGPLASELARIVPELPEHVAGLSEPVRSDPESERARLFEGVTGWLRTTAASVPVLLVLDDLHWADRPTLLLLRHLLHETTRDALLIVGTYRSTDLDRTHPLAAMLADLRRDPHVTRLAVDGLTADGVAELMERSAGHELDQRGIDLANAVFDETAGNPFFVGEIMLHLVESGALVRRDGRWTSDFTLADVGLPEGVREVVGRRITRLDDATQRTLSTAAVIGYEFALPVLVAVGGSDEDAVLDHLDAARAAGLVNEVGLERYRFGHALVRATLLEELSTTRRVRAHRTIGEALETLHADDLDPVISDLAYHFGEAAAADPDKAVEYATRAGDHSYATSAADDAARWYALALEHLDDAEDVATEVSLLTRLGRAEQASAAMAEAREHLLLAATRSRAAGLHDATAEALLVPTRTSFNEEQASDPEKIELLEAVLAALGDDPPLRARALGALAVELIFVGDVDRRGRLLDEASELARESGDALALADVALRIFAARPRSTWTAHQIRLDHSMLRDALEATQVTGDTTMQAEAELSLGLVGFVFGDGAQARACAGALEEHGRSNPAAFRMALLMLQMIAAVEGRLVEAEARSIEQWDYWQTTNLAEAVTFRSVEEYAVKREQGRLAELVPAWDDYLTAHPRDAAAAAMIAYALAVSGDVDAAAVRVHKGGREGFRDIPDDAGWPLAVAMWMETAFVVKDRDAARMLHECLRVIDGCVAFTGGIICGPVARLLALAESRLGDLDSADRHFEAAIELSRNLGSPLWTARSQLDWAETWFERGDTARALHLATDAETVIGTLTLPVLQRQLADLRDRAR